MWDAVMSERARVGEGERERENGVSSDCGLWAVAVASRLWLHDCKPPKKGSLSMLRERIFSLTLSEKRGRERK